MSLARAPWGVLTCPHFWASIGGPPTFHPPGMVLDCRALPGHPPLSDFTIFNWEPCGSTQTVGVWSLMGWLRSLLLSPGQDERLPHQQRLCLDVFYTSRVLRREEARWTREKLVPNF